MRAGRWSVVFVAATTVLLGAAGVTNGRTETRSSRSSSASAGAFASKARWVNLHGRRIYGVPMTVRVGAEGPLGIHPIQNRGTSLCMSSYPAQKGHAATQQTCNGSGNQQWVLARNGTGYSLYNRGMYPNNTDYCLDNYQGRTTDGNQQIMWPCFQDSNPPVLYEQGGSSEPGYVLLHTNGWRDNYCVTSLGDRSVNSPIEEWLCSKTAINQQWKGVTAG